MPDLLNHSITARPDSSLTVAVIRVQATVVDSADQSHVLADFTGANSIDFAIRVPGFSVADHKELAQVVAQWIIYRKAGLG